MAITLAGIRSELRALMALDERGEMDQPHRHKTLFQIVGDLQEFEINQIEEVATRPRSFFDKDNNLWMDWDGKLPPDMIKHASMFMVEHGHPFRTMINLSAYINLLHDIRRI